MTEYPISYFLGYATGTALFSPWFWGFVVLVFVLRKKGWL